MKIGCDNNNDNDIDVQQDSLSMIKVDANKSIVIDNMDNDQEYDDAQIYDYYDKLQDQIEQEWIEEMKEYYYMFNNVGIYFDFSIMKKRLDSNGLGKQLVYICESYQHNDDDNNDIIEHIKPNAIRLLERINPELCYDNVLPMIEHLTTVTDASVTTITPPLTPSAFGSIGAGKCQQQQQTSSSSSNIISAVSVNEPPSSSTALSTNQISTTTTTATLIKSEPIHPQLSIVSTMTSNDSSGNNQSHPTVSSSNLIDNNSQAASPKSISNINDVSSTIVNDPNNNNMAIIANDISDSTNNKTSLTVAKKFSISSSLDNESSTEQMVERAKKEAYVMKRIAELRKNGVWSIRRLPKVHEPQRCKTHWDYLLEEMQWLAADFFQERKWKRNSAKKCARLALKFHASKECQAERIEREEQLKLKRIASNMAKMIKQFWSEIEKVVEAKQEVQLNEKRKKIHDMQLRFIVDKADLLTEKLAQELIVPQKTSKASSTCSDADPSESGTMMKIDSTNKSKNEKRSDVDDQDDEFEQGSICSDDDEETIAKEEKDCQQADYTDEINALSNESEMPIEQLLANFLIQRDDKKNNETTDDELNDIAAGAQSIQPKGNTFSSVQVINKVPFLLKYQLREYQHIGLDWLVAMYEKNLNGILADEMGLGKTIQTIALIAHLACEKGIWGPHLIVVPTSVMLNWEMEFKKWCPALKIMTYFGNPKERRLKRKGWTKPDTFHVCITSYKLVIQDHQSFRRQKWVYFILDEAHNIKNFKSQRWQMLLNFNSNNRLLLTGTPLQNNLMELWSLMHFLMPKEFQSHREFKTWFDKPMTGMIEGQNDYNEDLIRRLHRVLRPFLLRRLKRDVEKQLPKKYEHIVRCPLSKRQRFLYEEYMSLANTKETLASGNFLSVINILMQLRKVCNHPNLFEVRKTISPFIDDGLRIDLPGIITSIMDHDPLKQINLYSHLNLIFSHLHYDSYKQTQIMKRYYDAFKMKDVINKQEDQIYVRLSDYKDFHRFMRNIRMVNSSSNTPNHLRPQLTLSNQILPVTNNNNNPSNKQQLIRSTNNQIRIKSLESSKIIPPSINNNNNTHIFINQGSNESPKIDRDNVSIEIRKCDEESKENRNKLFGNGKFAREETVLRLKTLFNDKLRRLALNNKSRCQGFARYCTDFFELFDFFGYKGIVNFIPWNKINNENNNNDKDEKNKDSKMLYGTSFINGLTLVRRSQRLKDGEEFDRNDLYYTTQNLIQLVDSPNSLTKNLEELMKRFIFAVPGILSPATRLNLSNVKSYKKIDRSNWIENLERKFSSDKFDVLTIPRVQFSLQLPETRLIQYDCGKLQILDKLLWQLKSGRHRILIFTQMSRMLDILEQFLNYHGHTYLRLDGTTKIDQRQALMERFNADQRIFCFILSTRSGGIGVNLTGADTVIFYDSDWNPTMDAQAQDRCHRIGQTRDVHIYRLVSERTVEENILKKAKQKKMLGDLAIEEGNFTTAFFKQTAIKELFDVGEQEMNEEPTISEPVEIIETEDNSVVDSAPATPSPPTNNNSSSTIQNAAFEQALCTAEEENDVTAAKIVRAEVAAELDEFDENIPIEEIPDEKSPEEEQIEELICQLTPVERYALKFLESSQDFLELKQAEEEMEETKKQWQKSINEWKKDQEELRKRELEELEDSIMTCSRVDGSISKVNHNSSQHSRLQLIHKNTHNHNDNTVMNRRNNSDNNNNLSRKIATRRSNNNNNNRNQRKNLVDNSSNHKNSNNQKNRRRQQTVANVSDNDDDDDDDDENDDSNSEMDSDSISDDDSIDSSQIQRSSKSVNKNRNRMNNNNNNRSTSIKQSTTTNRLNDKRIISGSKSNNSITNNDRFSTKRCSTINNTNDDMDAVNVRTRRRTLSSSTTTTTRIEQRNGDVYNSNILSSPKRALQNMRISILFVFMSFNCSEPMPIWAPPTPPQDENDFYIDYSFGFSYEKTLMSESQLPPVYMPKEHKRIRIDPLHARKQSYHSLSASGQSSHITKSSGSGHRRTDDLFNIPKSLFDRSVGRHRREILLFKSKLWPGSQNLVSISNKAIANIDSMPIQNLSTALSRSQQNISLINRMAEWTTNEDYSIIYVLLFMQELPFNLSIIYPGHTPNWDFVADQVNALNCFKRSSKLCRYHFETMMTDKDDQSAGLVGGNMVGVPGGGLIPANPTSKQQTQALNQQMLTAQLYRVSNMMQKTINDNNLPSAHSNTAQFIPHVQQFLAATKAGAKFQNLAAVTTGSGDSGEVSSDSNQTIANIQAKVLQQSGVGQSSSAAIHHVSLSQAQSMGLISQGVASIATISSPQQVDTSSTNTVSLTHQLNQQQQATTAQQFMIQQSSSTGSSQSVPVNVSIAGQQQQHKFLAISSPAGSSNPQTANLTQVTPQQLIASNQMNRQPFRHHLLVSRGGARPQVVAATAAQHHPSNTLQSGSSPGIRHIHMQSVRAAVPQQQQSTSGVGGTVNPSTTTIPPTAQRLQLVSQSLITSGVGSGNKILATSLITNSSTNTSNSQTTNTIIGPQCILSGSNQLLTPVSSIKTSAGNNGGGGGPQQGPYIRTIRKDATIAIASLKPSVNPFTGNTQTFTIPASQAILPNNNKVAM
ncbi:hypothetical protein DERF_012364 [Dermatophagoides farinae]|uniref:Helicase domino-like n=1 Tax=Dermatophagoides farinae TaxID=6954 RepID=A0A922HSE5_DERFA|nr:hypothetical protein DERF_012364 [Dermatophagoides farinae]